MKSEARNHKPETTEDQEVNREHATQATWKPYIARFFRLLDEGVSNLPPLGFGLYAIGVETPEGPMWWWVSMTNGVRAATGPTRPPMASASIVLDWREVQAWMNGKTPPTSVPPKLEGHPQSLQHMLACLFDNQPSPTRKAWSVR